MKKEETIYPRWMKLKTASIYSDISEKVLKHLAKTGKIDGSKVTLERSEKWIFDRLSIDAYMGSFMTADLSKDVRVLEICRRMSL